MNDYHINRLVSNLDALKSVLEGVKYHGVATDSDIYKVEEMVALLEEQLPKVEIPDLELGQYCIVFTEGDNLVIDSEGIIVGSDPDCPNRVNGIWGKVSDMSISWDSVKEQVDAGISTNPGQYRAEVDNQISGTIERIVRGTL
jgi:hypothetical protein